MSIFNQGVFGSAVTPLSVAPATPALTPEEQDSLLSRIGSSALHGLGWVGGSLSKAFGGRAIRGLLGGRPEELASIIPFSDTLGITNPANEVTGSDLLGGNRDTSLLSPEGIGGLGIDILTDPSTYLSFGGGALTKLGTMAKKAGVLPKTGALRAAGLAAGTPEAASLASHVAQMTGESADVAGRSLGGHIGVGLPFMGNSMTFNLAPAGNALATGFNAIPGSSKITDLVSKATDPVRRLWRAGFDPEVLGQYSAKGQELAPGFKAAREAGQEAGKDVTARVMRGYGAADMLADPQGMRRAIETGAQASAPKSVSAWHDAYQAAKAGGATAEDAINAADKIAPQEWVHTGSKLVKNADETASYIGKDGRKYIIDIAPQLVKDVNGNDINAIRAFARDEQGNEVARVLFDRRGSARGGLHAPKDYTAGGLSVDTAHQEQGLAKAMYDFAKENLEFLGKEHSAYGRILPSSEQTAAVLTGGTKGGGKAIWESNAERALKNAGVTEGTSQGAQRAAGIAKPYLDDLFKRRTFLGDSKEELANFFPRQATQPELDLAQEFLRTPSSSREKILLHNSEESLNKMVRDPVVGTSARTAANEAEAAAHLVAKYNVATDEARDLASFLHSLDPARQKAGLFTNDATHDFMTHVVAGEARVRMLENLYPVLAQEAGAATPGSIKLSEALTKIGLTDSAQRRAYEVLHDSGKISSLSPKAFSLDAEGIAKHLEGVHISREAANVLGAILKPNPAKDGEFAKLVKNLIDVPSNLFRGHVTQPFPGFHERNAMTSLGWIQTLLTGSPKAALEGNQMMTDLMRGGVIKGASQWPAYAGKGLTDAQVSEQIGNWLFAKGLTSQGHVADILGHSAAPHLLEGLPGMLPDRKVGLSAIPEYLRSWLPRSLEQANPLNMRGIGGEAVSKFAPAAAGEQLATVIEQTGRGGGALALLKQGYMPDMAAAMTKAAHVDYSNLTGFEREVMRRLVPFYSWAKGNIPFQLRQVAENPGGMTGQALRVATAAEGRDPGYVPEYLGQGVIAGLGKTDEGKRQFLSQLGLPFEDLGNLTSIRTLAGQLNPALKYGIEQITGQQLMSGRELGAIHPLPGVADGVTPTWMQNLLANSPISRYASTIRGLGDERNTLPGSALNLLTGSRVSEVDPASARRRAVEDYTAELLKRNPAVRTFSEVYVPAADRASLSPSDLQLLQLYQLAQRNRLARP